MIAAAQPSLVAVRLPAGDGWLAAVNAVWRRGDAVLPLAVDAPPAVTEATLRALRPTRIIDPSGEHPLEDPAPVAPGTAAVVMTSGSTGDPKGAVLSWSALESSARATIARLDLTPDDRWLGCLPLHHIAGLQVVVRARLLGGAPVLHERFDATRVAEQRDVTVTALVPTMLRRLLDAGADLSHLRWVLLGGAAPGPQLLAHAADAGLPVVTTYGMTETCGGCVYDGIPLDDVRIDVGAGGIVRVAGPVLFSGYRLRDDLTAAVVREGWFSTADLGRLEHGRLTVLGRADDVIVTGGEKVGAVAIAQLLEEHPHVAEAAVVGVPDAQWGQRVVAFVVARGADPPTLPDVRAFVAARLPGYAAPRALVVVDELPRLASGKVDRLALQEFRV